MTTSKWASFYASRVREDLREFLKNPCERCGAKIGFPCVRYGRDGALKQTYYRYVHSERRGGKGWQPVKPRERTVDPTRERWSADCPTCHAAPGRPCHRTDRTGAQIDYAMKTHKTRQRRLATPELKRDQLPALLALSRAHPRLLVQAIPGGYRVAYGRQSDLFPEPLTALHVELIAAWIEPEPSGNYSPKLDHSKLVGAKYGE